jgi:hypothetical protein
MMSVKVRRVAGAESTECVSTPICDAFAFVGVAETVSLTQAYGPMPLTIRPTQSSGSAHVTAPPPEHVFPGIFAVPSSMASVVQASFQ